MGVTDNVQSISASPQEAERGTYSLETLAKVLGALNQDGLVLLKGVIPVQVIDDLNAKMCKDVEEMLANPDQVFNHGIKCKNVLIK